MTTILIENRTHKRVSSLTFFVKSFHTIVVVSVQGLWICVIFYIRFEDRIIIKDVHLRKALRTKTGTISDELIMSAEATAPWLIPILKELKDCEVKNLPKPWKQLIHDLSASTSAIGLIDPAHYSPADIASITKNGVQSPNDLKTLKTCIPTIYNVLREFPDVLQILTPCIDHIASLIDLISNMQPHSLPPYDLAEDLLDSIPNLPPLSRRGHYAMDAKKKKVCTKNAPRHRTLTSGIFTMSCSHGR